MFSATLSNDDLCDRYIYPHVYDDLSGVCVPSIDTHLPLHSSSEHPRFIPITTLSIIQETPYTFDTSNLRTLNHGSGVYLSDQTDIEAELDAIFGKNHHEQHTEADRLGASHKWESPDSGNYGYELLRQEGEGDAWAAAWLGSDPVVDSASTFSGSRTSQMPSNKRRTSFTKRYTCDFCNKQFNLQQDRLRHERTLHRQEHNHVYRCVVPGCAKSNKTYNRLDNFKKHLGAKHRTESQKELVQRSRTSGIAFSVVTPDTYS